MGSEREELRAKVLAAVRSVQADDATAIQATDTILDLLPPDLGGWRGIESAPKDGTPILAWCVHPNARWAGDSQEWAAPVVTQWIDHNGGGWTWNGLAGTLTHWMPLPPPPTGAR